MNLVVQLVGEPLLRSATCRYCGRTHTGSVRPTYFTSYLSHSAQSLAQAVGIYQHLMRPDELMDSPASARDLIPTLREGLARLEARRDQLRDAFVGAINYDLFVPWLREYLAACEQHPDAVARASEYGWAPWAQRTADVEAQVARCRQHARRAGELVSLASLGGKVGERLQRVLVASLALLDADRDLLEARMHAEHARGYARTPKGPAVVHAAGLRLSQAEAAHEAAATAWRDAVLVLTASPPEPGQEPGDEA